MSEKTQDENKQTDTGQELLKQMTSKLEELQKNVGSRIDSLETKLQKKQPVPEPEEDDLETLIYSNPKKAVEKITKQVKAEVTKEQKNISKEQSEFSEKYNQLAQEFPEIMDQGSNMHKRARDLVGELSDGREWNTAALERAVLRAANEQGIVAMKHRRNLNQEDDDSYVGAGGSTGTPGAKRKAKDDEGLDPRTLAFAAEIHGVEKANDPNYQKKLKEINKARKNNWNKYR